MTTEKKLKLTYLSQSSNLTIKRANKDENIVIINMAEYIEHCKLLLNVTEFYEKLDANSTLISTAEVQKSRFYVKE